MRSALVATLVAVASAAPVTNDISKRHPQAPPMTGLGGGLFGGGAGLFGGNAGLFGGAGNSLLGSIIQAPYNLISGVLGGGRARGGEPDAQGVTMGRRPSPFAPFLDLLGLGANANAEDNSSDIEGPNGPDGLNGPEPYINGPNEQDYNRPGPDRPSSDRPDYGRPGQPGPSGDWGRQGPGPQTPEPQGPSGDWGRQGPQGPQGSQGPWSPSAGPSAPSGPSAPAPELPAVSPQAPYTPGPDVLTPPPSPPMDAPPPADLAAPVTTTTVA